MTIGERDKRALILLGLSLAVILIYLWTAPKDPTATVVAASASRESVPAAEQRLARMRQSVARVPGKETVLKQVSAELAVREKSLIDAETGAQATEQLLQFVRQIARAQAPPVELRSIELGQPKAFGDAYGETTLSISTECRMEQLVNMMLDISTRKELVSTRDLRISAANAKEKTVNVRLTIAGLVPRRLVPQKREAF